MQNHGLWIDRDEICEDSTTTKNTPSMYLEIVPRINKVWDVIEKKTLLGVRSPLQQPSAILVLC